MVLTVTDRPEPEPREPLRLPPNCRDVTAEKIGTVIGIIGATGVGKAPKVPAGSGVTLRAPQSASATASRHCYLLRGPTMKLIFGHAILLKKRINVARQ
jgi:hypothetical protein